MADVHLLAVLLSSTSAIHSCHLAAPSPHSEDLQVRAGGWLVSGNPHPKTAPADFTLSSYDSSIGSLWHMVTH